MKTHSSKNIFIVAGEPSGDVRGAELVKELRELLPDVKFWGIGGDNMAREGVELVEHIREFSIIGISEVLKKLPKILGQLSSCLSNAEKRKPTAAILIDYPGFNLTLARELHKKNIPVIYYIIPQVWAWGRKRAYILKRFVKKVMVIFDFEKHFLKAFGIDADFVGHPLVDRIPEEKRKKTDNTFTIALLPGSRKMEINNLLPEMLKAAERIKHDLNKINFVIAESPNVPKATYDSMLGAHPSLNIKRVTNDTYGALQLSDFAIVASGTATLETAMMEKPLIIVYKTSAITAFIARRLSTVKYLGLVNLIAGKELAPELIQEDATAEKIAAKTLEMIQDKAVFEKICSELKGLSSSLGERGAAKRAAKSVRDFISSL